jgi:Flp pilus assembly protein TadG
MALFTQFGGNNAGNVAAAFALAMIPLAAAAGAAVDYSRASAARASLQSAADAAALRAAAARVSTDQQRLEVVRSFFPNATPTDPGTQPFGERTASASVAGRSVTVTAATRIKTGVLGVAGIPAIDITARATAVRINQGPPVCVLALNPTAPGAVTFTGSASFVAEGCAVHSNSTSASALTVQGSASARAAALCAVGGASVSGSVTPAPETGCDRLDDPFRNLAQAVTSGCDQTNAEVKPGTSATLSPGLYCNGLDIKGAATLRPGLYIVKDGPLTVSAQASLTGSGVTLYLTGRQAGFTINGGGAVELSAMPDGAYSGLLIVQDRQANPGAGNTLNGNSDTKLTGAIYTPTQTLTVSGSGSFGQASAFMPLIADQIKFAGSSTTHADLSAVRTPSPLPLSPNGARLVD